MTAPSTYGLTAQQLATMRIIQAEMDVSGGRPPSVDEIRQRLGLGSNGNVHRIVSALVNRGYLTRLRGQARSLQILKRVPALQGGTDHAV